MSIAVNLKPSNSPSISGCPGVPKTFPQFDSILEIRQTNSDSNQPYINLVTIKFVTIDTLKFSKSNVPNSTTKVNYESKFPVNQRIIGIDLPFSIPIDQAVGPTLESNSFKVNHYIQVEVALMNKQIRNFEFPVVIKKYDNLPIYRQFNQPITKIIDSKDSLFFVEYSLPYSSVGPSEELQLNLKINKSHIQKSSLKLKKIGVEIVEIFDCRCEHSFIKETVIASQSFEIGKDVETEYSQQFNINLQNSSNSLNPYALFDKQQNAKLLSLNNPSPSKTNNLRPTIIDHDTENPVPFKAHNSFQTFKSNFFQVYYQLNIKIKYNRTKSLKFEQPFTVSNYSRIDSMELIKWILNESKLVNHDQYEHDSKHDVFKRKNVPKMTLMRSKAEKENFISK